MSEAPELLPCPFCGGEAENNSHHSCDCCGQAYTGVIQCRKCGAEVSHLDTDAEAIAAWNTRTDLVIDAAVAAERAACARLVGSMFAPGSEEEVTCDVAAAAIRARGTTDALAERDARVRAEALREAHDACENALSLIEGANPNRHDALPYIADGVEACQDAILALIPDET